jgi:hypothetical protein
MGLATRQVRLSPEAEPILDSVAASFGGGAGLALSELLIAHESIESFLDELSSNNALHRPPRVVSLSGGNPFGR